MQLKNQVIELWQRMTKVQKSVIIGSTALLFVILVLLTKGASTPDYGVLFNQMDDQEAGQIVQKLKEMKIDYKLVDNGAAGGGVSIMVPSKDIPQTRLELATENLPIGGVVGFESFDKTQFGETDTDRRTRYLRALQGELTRTIESMAEVDKARVHIVMPEPSLFSEQEKNATAAIMLKLKPNQTLNEEQARGIVKLVTNSVEGLKSENVTIVDMAGNILTEDLGSDEQVSEKKLTVTQVEMQKQYQKEMQNSIQTMLERIVGVGKAVVRVQLELDFDRIQQKKQEYGDKVPRSSQTTEETSETTNSSPSGTPGTDSNVPGYVTSGQTGTSRSTKTEKIVNNEINLFEENREVAPGSIKRLSVAVVVDKQINASQQKTIEDVVKGASGFDSQRGDQISVAGMPFNTDYQDEMNRALADAQKKQQMLIYGGLGLLALLIIGGVAANIIIKRRRAAELAKQFETSEDEEFEMKPVPVNELQTLISSEQDEKEKEEPDNDNLSPEELEKLHIHEHVEKIAREQPGDIAQLLKSWLAEE